MKKISKSQLKSINNTNADLSDKVLSIGNQGKLGSCSAFGIANAREIILHPNSVELSAWFLYKKTLENDRIEGEEDTGLYIQDALDVFKNIGCCEEKYWKYNETHKHRGTMKKNALVNAETYKIGKWSTVEKHLDAVRWTVNQGVPVIVSVGCYEGLRRPGKKGVITNVGTNKPKGNHCMVVVGYDDKTKLFKVLNSWGDKWADNGYCYMGYDYFMRILKEAYYVSDEKATEKGFFAGLKNFILNIVTFPIKLIQNGIGWFKEKPLM
jgi:C1A family cysteine protease